MTRLGTRNSLLSDEEYVAETYRQILGREADSGGLDKYVGELRDGMDRNTVLRIFLSGEEFARRSLSSLERTLAERYVLGEQSGRFDADYAPPGEAGRSYVTRVKSGFFDRFCRGTVLDVGSRGYDNPESKPAIPGATGIDLDYPGYDGTHLPFEDGSVDCIFSSHCLEHVDDEANVLRDWLRVLKVGGYIVCIVPHQTLYEKKRELPSRWNKDHKRMYTSASLIAAFEAAFEPNSFRIRHLLENDSGNDYSLGPEEHSSGPYEIELAIEKIVKPDWDLE